MERDAVRIAALRELMRTVVAPAEAHEIAGEEAQVARLLLSGRGVGDICNALALPPATVYAMLVDLAR